MDAMGNKGLLSGGLALGGVAFNWSIKALVGGWNHLPVKTIWNFRRFPQFFLGCEKNIFSKENWENHQATNINVWWFSSVAVLIRKKTTIDWLMSGAHKKNVKIYIPSGTLISPSANLQFEDVFAIGKGGTHHCHLNLYRRVYTSHPMKIPLRKNGGMMRSWHASFAETVLP